jgi:hypothetical protein
MRTQAVPTAFKSTGADLDDARESLAYWEDRARRLPRHAVRRRREALVMADRWSARVAEAERASYGRGALGALALVLTEGRLPEPARHAGMVVARSARRAMLVAVTALVALLLVAAVAVVELLAALIHAVA